MSRPSVDAIALLGAIGPGAKAPVPAELSESEAALWAVIVDSKPSEWFGPDSVPVLKEYCRCAALCDQLAVKVREVWDTGDMDAIRVPMALRDREVLRLMALATKLRLTQQSRYTPQASATANRKVAGRRPWEG